VLLADAAMRSTKYRLLLESSSCEFVDQLLRLVELEPAIWTAGCDAIN
jgi:hypothetical protein